MKRLFTLSILATLLLSVFFATRASASFLDDFVIKEFDAVYNLSKKADGGSRIDVEWTIKADFPPNQNRGLVLEFIDKFNSRDTKLTIHSITDEYEVPVPYEIEGSNVLLGDNRFVSGLTTYVIRYSQEGVVKEYENTGRDEFYWNVIGHHWRVPIEKARVVVNLTQDLVDKFEESACYYGAAGSGKRCNIIKMGNSFITNNIKLGIQEGVTVAIGMELGTFSDSKSNDVIFLGINITEIIDSIIQYFLLIVGCIFSIFVLILFLVKKSEEVSWVMMEA